MPKLIDRLPAPVANRLRTRLGTQFLRFALVAVLSLGASEIALGLFLYALHLTAGISGVSAAIVGAVVSYFLSRRAWGRKGRPDVVRETIPFWLVSVGAWLVLGLATKLGVHLGRVYHLHHLSKDVVVGGVYFLANCITFMARFLIFHYFLFADGSKAGQAEAPVGIDNESLSPVTVPASSQDPDNPAR